MLAETDPEIRAMAQEELTQLEERLPKIEEDLKLKLLPKDPNDEKNVLLEIRAGTGGDEASLFAAELFRMYSRFAEQHRWKVEILSSSESGVGGLKEVIASIDGDRAYSQLKYESGVHRVQRVPATETQGRIHTSTVTVAVLPEAEDVDIKIEAKDLRIDIFCSAGPGGQSVNTTYSAVRITTSRPAPSSTARRKNRSTRTARRPCAAARPPLRHRAGEAADAPAQSAAAGRLRRPLGEDPHLQLPAGPPDRPPHRPHPPPARRDHGGQAAAGDRRGGGALPGRAPEGGDGEHRLTAARF